MKLNSDIIRDVLLFLEEYLVFNSAEENREYKTSFTEYEISNRFTEKYLESDVRYAIAKLFEGGYISASNCNWLDVYDITYRGHELLNAIREEPAYTKVKNVISASGSTSLELLKTVGFAAAQALALSKLHLS